MKILITGATGFVGTRLTHKCLDRGDEVVVLTRNIDKAREHFKRDGLTYFEWSHTNQLPPESAFSDIDGVIHLMGENIGGKRWSAEQKNKLRNSRVEATQNLVKAIDQFSRKTLRFFISAAAIGIYPVNHSKVLDEDSAMGYGFLSELCKDWEDASLSVKAQRRVIVRTGVVLEKDGGALEKMLPPFKMGVGGPIGDGNQMMSWIHMEDLINLYLEATTNNEMSGVYNAVAPHAVNNFDFTKSLGAALHRPTLIPVPATALMVMLGEMSTIVLDSQNIVSKRLDYSKFKYGSIDSALKAIFEKKNEKKSVLDTKRSTTA